MLFLIWCVVLHWYRLCIPTNRLQDGVVTLPLIAEVAAPLVVLRVRRLQSLLFRVQRLSEQHLQLLVLLLAMMEGVGQISTMHCVIPMALMEAAARTHYTTFTDELR